jgi:hypothetical protein
MAETREHWGRIFQPENYSWERPYNAGDAPSPMQYRYQGYPRNLKPGGVLRPERIVVGSAPTGGGDLSRKVVASLLAGGAAYGLTLARSKRGYTPFIVGGLAAVLVGRAVDTGSFKYDDRVFGRNII